MQALFLRFMFISSERLVGIFRDCLRDLVRGGFNLKRKPICCVINSDTKKHGDYWRDLVRGGFNLKRKPICCVINSDTKKHGDYLRDLW
jgi:ribosomal protein L36